MAWRRASLPVEFDGHDTELIRNELADDPARIHLAAKGQRAVPNFGLGAVPVLERVEGIRADRSSQLIRAAGNAALHLKQVVVFQRRIIPK
jgi:hypothetical protein